MMFVRLIWCLLLLPLLLRVWVGGPFTKLKQEVNKEKLAASHPEFLGSIWGQDVWES